LTESIDIPATLVFYETPHRIASSLRDCESILGDRNAAVARELTKLHEETLRGTLGELARHFAETTPKGEFVVVIERAQASDLKDASDTELFLQRVEELVKSGMERRPAMRKAAKEHGLTRSEAYRLLQTSG
jgi:16S rRNA (cytidine1402-2'-O)-methyltransferase